MRTIYLVLIAGVVACSSNDGGPPANVAGTYTLTVTDQQNGCNVENFATNASQTGIVVTLAQNGANVSATVGSYAGLVLAFSAGNTLAGTVDGSFASLSSTANHQLGGCAYSTTATANMNFDGDQVQGTILYTDTGNGSTDCGVMQQCTSTQTFTGAR